LYESHDRQQRSRQRSSRERPSPVGLIAGDEDFWVLLAGSGEPLESRAAIREDEPAAASPMRMCRAVLADGRLAIGEVDPSREELLAEILGTS
jgi:hypothetical protein